MVTPVNERVKKYRERQRQAHPQEPLWNTLIGRLHVADLWLSRGGAAPANFADAIRTVAAKIGLKITEEPPAAAEEPYRPKGVPERVSAIFEPLVDQLIAQLPARSQPKFRRNLDKFLVDLQCGCRHLVEEEIYVGITSTRDRWVAQSAFTTTCDPDVVNKDVTSTFWNFYREMRGLKKLLSAHYWQQFQRPFDGLIELVGKTCQINLPVELDRRLKARQAAEIEHARAELERLNESQRLLNKSLLASVMTDKEQKLIRGLLHPDKHPGEDHQRYVQAFQAFARLG